jgi:glycosyltransferase involved in cell wall biosynthesis
LRICLISYEYPPDVGGEATYTRNLAVGLAKLGHEVFLIVPDKGRVPDEYGETMVKRAPVKVRRIPMLKVGSFMFAAARELRHLNLQKRVDVAHYTFDYPSLPIPLNNLGITTVVTVHHLHLVEALSMLRAGSSLSVGLPTLARGFFTTLSERAVLRGADSVIAVSRFTRDSLVRYGGVRGDKITVVANGIDIEPFLGSKDNGVFRARQSLGSKRVILFVGRLGPSKGLEDLVRAFGKAKARLGPACLVIVGSGQEEYTGRLRRLAASLGLGQDVVFTGRVNSADLHEAYASSSVVVLPSLMEGFGISLLEAMAAGKPCIATRVGAIPEIVLPGESGLLVSPGDPDALSTAIAQMTGRPEEAWAMGEKGRELVRDAYTLEQMVSKTQAVYFEANTHRD